MTLTKRQKEAVKGGLNFRLIEIFPDAFDREEVIEEILDDVIEDIEETADWEGYEDDEWCEGDVDIALARVLKGRIVKE